MVNNSDYFTIEYKDDIIIKPYVQIKGYKPHGLDPTLIEIDFDESYPVPNKPFRTDFLKGAGYYFSEKIADVIKELNIQEIRFIKTEWVGKQNSIEGKYFYFDVSNKIAAMDKNKSIYEYSTGLYLIYKFVMDIKKLNEIALEKRLVFRLRESKATKIMFHKSVVEKIMSANPVGLQFVSVEDDK